jgi:hypothetical protein
MAKDKSMREANGMAVKTDKSTPYNNGAPTAGQH